MCTPWKTNPTHTNDTNIHHNYTSISNICMDSNKEKGGNMTEKEWQEVAKPVEVLVGCKLIAFDPNFVFRMKDGSQVNVPFTFIMELSHQLSDSMIIDNVYYKNLKKKENPKYDESNKKEDDPEWVGFSNFLNLN